MAWLPFQNLEVICRHIIVFADKDLKWSRVAERCIKSALVDNKTNFDIDNDVDSFDETCDDETYDELSSETSDNEESLKTGNSKGNITRPPNFELCGY